MAKADDTDAREADADAKAAASVVVAAGFVVGGVAICVAGTPGTKGTVVVGFGRTRGILAGEVLAALVWAGAGATPRVGMVANVL